jgi:putative Holliday junction resolvase
MQLKKVILSIDFGLKRVGLAITDPLHITITPLQTLNYNANNFWNQLLNIIVSKKVGEIVIGIPLDTPADNELRQQLDFFIQKLGHSINQTDVSINLIDEAFTSKDAMELMITLGKKKKYRATKGTTDIYAACIILREYLLIKGDR